MKYDRPAHELLEECVNELPEPIGRQDIMAWFRSRYPAISEGTISVMIQTRTTGLQGDGHHERLMAMPPLLTSAGRGRYLRYRDEAQLTPVPQAASRVVPQGANRLVDSSPPSDVIMIGCVKSKLAAPAVARDLYIGSLFRKRRAYAEASGLPWFVLSSRWGLVAPDELIAPYELYLPKTPLDYRRSWGQFTSAQLAREHALAGLRVEIHAGDAYVESLRPSLESAGAVVIDAVDANSFGETLAWYATHVVADAPLSSETADARRAASGIAAPSSSREIDGLVDALTRRENALSVVDAAAVPNAQWGKPGLYSWWVDEGGAKDLSAGLGIEIAEGLIYASLAGATRWPSGKRSSNTLHGRLVGMHINGSAEFSTFRRTLGAVLSATQLALLTEDQLSTWMRAHLSVVAVTVDDADELGRLEREVLARLDPPLNLMSMEKTPTRRVLAGQRRMSRDGRGEDMATSPARA